MSMPPSAEKITFSPITPEERRLLARDFGRDELLHDLRKLPGLTERIPDPGHHRPEPDPWLQGVSIAPLSLTYPAGADQDHFELTLNTDHAMISVGFPLPKADQNPPLLCMGTLDPSQLIFWLQVRWPRKGSYVVTFLMRNMVPQALGHPRYQTSRMSAPRELVPSQAQDPIRWSCIVEVDQEPSGSPEFIGIYPSASEGFANGFYGCLLSKVSIYRL
jgi:hypothetical protein